MDTHQIVIKKNPLFFAWFFPALVDASVTLIGQDGAYWTSKVVNEASPAYYFLIASPWIFAAGSIIWFISWYLIFRKLKEPYNFFLMFLFIAGHTWGSSSWLWRMMRLNGIYNPANQVSVMIAWTMIVVYFAVIATIATKCLNFYLKRRK